MACGGARSRGDRDGGQRLPTGGGSSTAGHSRRHRLRRSGSPLSRPAGGSARGSGGPRRVARRRRPLRRRVRRLAGPRRADARHEAVRSWQGPLPTRRPGPRDPPRLRDHGTRPRFSARRDARAGARRRDGRAAGRRLRTVTGAPGARGGRRGRRRRSWWGRVSAGCGTGSTTGWRLQRRRGRASCRSCYSSARAARGRRAGWRASSPG